MPNLPIKYALEGMNGRFNPENGWALPSSLLGNSFDEFGRDVFNGVFDEFTTDADRETAFGTYDNSTAKNYSEVFMALKAFQSRLASNGQVVIATGTHENPGHITAKGTLDVTVRGENGMETRKVRVAGTLDVLAIDDKGNLHIYDFKTHRGAFDASHAVEKGYDRQLSMYAKFLEDEYGLKVKSINIIPVKVNYPTPSGRDNEGNVIRGAQKTYRQTRPGSNQLEVKDITADDSRFEPYKGANFQVEAEFPLTRLNDADLVASFDKLTDAEKEAIVEAIQDQSETPAAEAQVKAEDISSAKPDITESDEEEEEEGLSLKSRRFGRRKNSEDTLKDDSDSEGSGNKPLSLQQRPMKSSDKFTGEHVEGLEEYEERLTNMLIHDTGDSDISTVDGSDMGGQSLRQGGKARVGGLDNHNNNRLTADEIRQELEEIKAEKERRQKKWEAFRKKYHVSKNGTISTEDFVRAFNDMNTDAVNSRLMQRIIEVFSGKFGDLSFSGEINYKGAYNGTFGGITISSDLIGRDVDANAKAATMLHELIHKATSEAIDLYKVPVVRRMMSKETRSAIKTLYAIHDSLKKAYPKSYGAKTVKEMVAEISKGNLREQLNDFYYDKNANVTLWDRFKNAIKSLFGLGSVQEIALSSDKEVLQALDTLLDNYDKTTAIVVKAGRFVGNVTANAINRLRGSDRSLEETLDEIAPNDKRGLLERMRELERNCGGLKR